MRPFQGCWRRIERAKAHSKALADEWNSFIENDPYLVSVDVERDGKGRIRISPACPFPTSFALCLGEMLYQFRAALDGCVYAAAILETGQDPPPNENLLAFPICASEADFKNSARNTAPLSQKLKAIVESVQPYKIPELEPQLLVLNINRALGILHEWARRDRHRQLHVLASWASNARPKLMLPDGVWLTDLTVSNDGLLKDEREVARFGLTGYHSGMNVKANPDLMLDIAVDEIPPPCADNDTLGNRLETIGVAVRTIVDSFERALNVK